MRLPKRESITVLHLSQRRVKAARNARQLFARTLRVAMVVSCHSFIRMAKLAAPRLLAGTARLDRRVVLNKFPALQAGFLYQNAEGRA